MSVTLKFGDKLLRPQAVQTMQEAILPHLLDALNSVKFQIPAEEVPQAYKSSDDAPVEVEVIPFAYEELPDGTVQFMMDACWEHGHFEFVVQLTGWGAALVRLDGGDGSDTVAN